MGDGKKKKKRTPRFNVAEHARRLARAVVGAPPAERVIPPKKTAKSKHKKREFERELE
jgi:hypothetical protein